MELDINIPSCIRNASVNYEVISGNQRRYILTGNMGYYIEEVKEGVMLKYGPLILAPLRYVSNGDNYIDYSNTTVPEGYVPPMMPKGYPAIVPPEKKDSAGFLVFNQEPWPVWQCYEEGVLSPLAYGELSVNVPLYFPDGQIRNSRFYPMLNSTTSIVSFDLPFIFEKG